MTLCVKIALLHPDLIFLGSVPFLSVSNITVQNLSSFLFIPFSIPLSFSQPCFRTHSSSHHHIESELQVLMQQSSFLSFVAYFLPSLSIGYHIYLTCYVVTVKLLAYSLPLPLKQARLREPETLSSGEKYAQLHEVYQMVNRLERMRDRDLFLIPKGYGTSTLMMSFRLSLVRPFHYFDEVTICILPHFMMSIDTFDV